ncbi:porin [Novispirillum itersonii]|uniref:Putative porin n=1 Tax=Novispirillum itersonii TaxID=189 RepID=A0A7X0DL82_NOVIT|nr:porin [Novispirillum itersonii]MBB6209715.1 putative porin [Novispirillum itersonii]
MKKILIGTSALVAAAAFAGSANAADPIKLSIGGYGAVMVGYASNDDAFIRQSGNEVSAVDVKGDNEIHFSGKTTLDNGLTVAVKYEIESGGRSMSDVSDEWSISLSGNFGTIKTGADDNALTMIHNNAPIVGGGLAGGDLLDGAYVVKPGSVSTETDTAIDTNGDREAISYISPSFAGFTFGASYVPSASSTHGDDNPGATTTANTVVSDAYGVGLGYAGKFGDVTVSADIGWLTADTGNQVKNRDEYQAGLKFGYAGFEVGGAYRKINMDGITGQLDADGTVWEAGVSYKTGPYGISLTYLDAKQADVGQTSVTSKSDDKSKALQLSTSYNMGPGVDLVGGLAYVKFDSAGTASTGNDNDGWVAATGLSLTF